MTPDRIERETLIAAPVERVWELVTAPEHVGTWFGDAGAEIDLRPGGAMALRWEEHGTVRARVERVEAPRVFAYRWASRMDAEPEEGASTLVEFFLEPDARGTLLRVVESGFAALEGTEAENAELAERHEGGWGTFLDRLAELATSADVSA